MDKDRANLLVAAAWMVGISLLLFFLPAVNGLIGGAVGGYKAGTAGRALGAALIPALIVAVGLWLILGLIGAPVVGFFAGTAAGMLALFADLGLFIGALIGGWMAQNRAGRRIAT